MGLCFAADQATPPPSSSPAIEARLDAGLMVAQASEDARYLGRWIQARNDNAGQPFAIVDKKAARLFVFDAQQTLVGSSTVLTGSAAGDDSVPGVGERAQQFRLAREERTTPAGRFASEPGHNLAGEDIVWFDYGAALAIHRLRADANYERRARSLSTPTPDDNRASLGCVVVPVAFYDRVVRPLLGTRKGTVYVLPETRSVQAIWPGGPGGPSDMPREAATTLARSD
jgi:hypothetical protein